MFSRTFETAVVALAAISSVTAQTVSTCNPTKGDTCPPNMAFGGVAEFDFTKSSSIEGDFAQFWDVDGGVKYNTKLVNFNNGANFIIFEEANAPRITTHKYLFFGKVEVVMQAAPGRGIVSSIVLESDDLDEIDWEFVGADQNHVQTNFYAKGVNDYTHGKYFETAFNPMTGLHTYTIEWTPDFMTFAVDGQVLRKATPAEAENGAKWPQTPMRVRLGTWVGGKGTSQGTIDWAGGLADWSQAPFTGIYKSIKITDYGMGKAGATQYEYTDRSGTRQSIKIVGGRDSPLPSDGNPAPTNSDVTGKTQPATTLSGEKSTSTGGSAQNTNAPSNTTGGPATGATTTGSTTTGTRAPTQTPSSADNIKSRSVAALAATIFFGYLVLW